jgi:hypothetical protein
VVRGVTSDGSTYWRVVWLPIVNRGWLGHIPTNEDLVAIFPAVPEIARPTSEGSEYRDIVCHLCGSEEEDMARCFGSVAISRFFDSDSFGVMSWQMRRALCAMDAGIGWG